MHLVFQVRIADSFFETLNRYDYRRSVKEERKKQILVQRWGREFVNSNVVGSFSGHHDRGLAAFVHTLKYLLGDQIAVYANNLDVEPAFVAVFMLELISSGSQ